MLTISNGSYFGGGFPIAPGSSVDDGQLHACRILDARPLERRSHAEVMAEQQRQLAVIKAVPGVVSAAWTNQMPMSRSGNSSSVRLTPNQPRQSATPAFYSVHPGFVSTLARMVGATRESVNRTLSELSARGLVRVEDRCYVVPDPEALAHHAAELRALAEDVGADVIVVDSVLIACGGADPGAEGGARQGLTPRAGAPPPTPPRCRCRGFRRIPTTVRRGRPAVRDHRGAARAGTARRRPGCSRRRPIRSNPGRSRAAPSYAHVRAPVEPSRHPPPAPGGREPVRAPPPADMPRARRATGSQLRAGTGDAQAAAEFSLLDSEEHRLAIGAEDLLQRVTDLVQCCVGARGVEHGRQHIPAVLRRRSESAE